MYKFIEYTKEMKDAWNSYAHKNGTAFHTIEWKEVLEQTFSYNSAYYIIQNDQGKLCGILPIITGRNLSMNKVGISTPFANYLDLCCDGEDVRNFIFRNIRCLIEKNGLKSIELRLRNDAVPDADTGLNKNNYILVLPLDGDEDKVMSYSTSSNRNHIRKAYKSGCFGSCFDMSNLNSYYRVYCSVMKRLGSPAQDIGFFERIANSFPDNTVLLTILDTQTGSVIGGMFFFKQGNTLIYMWGGCLAEYNRKYVNNYMYWEAIKYGIQNGFTQLDFGRSPFESGTYNFKKQFGAIPVNLKYCAFALNGPAKAGIERGRLLDFSVEIWKVMPSIITDFAGKRLIKYVMP